MPNLKHFLTQKMKMSGPYQPVIIKHLIKNNGKAHLQQIAEELSQKDPDNVAYYLKKLKVYPKKVLADHQIAKLANEHYQLLEDIELNELEKSELIKICDLKLKEYYLKIQPEDETNSGWGRKRILLLEKHPYCSLCGARANDETELDVDHIIPQSKGGSDDVENLQVLCHRCNRAKGNYLLKSSKQIKDEHLNAKHDCLFCQLPSDRVSFENEYIKVVKDIYPVSEGHTLFITKRHVQSAIELTDIEMLHIFKQAQAKSENLKAEDNSIEGFNMGFNVGTVAGQSVMHVHFHLIPRRTNDTPEPFGGIRNVIEGKGKY